ncbi:MAG: thioredoxin domain-containing protein [Nitrososphaera sp.]
MAKRRATSSERKGGLGKSGGPAKLVMVGVAGVVIAIVAFAALSQGAGSTKPSASSESTNPAAIIQQILTPTTPNAYALQTRTTSGDPKVTIVEFGDYQCNSCGIFHKNTQDQVISDLVNTGKAKFMFKDFNINDYVYKPTMGSTMASEAAYCAGDQGKFWAYHDQLYNIQKPEGTEWISESLLKQVASDVGVQNIDQFTSCLDSQKYISAVQTNHSLADQLGLDATPTFVVLADGKQPVKLVGAQPYSSFESVVNSMSS